jgi:hypothetical protein
MESSNNSSIIEDLEQSLLEVMAKHLINDLNRLLDVKNEPIESEVRKQRKLLLNILFENNPDLEMNLTQAKNVNNILL